MEVDMIYIWCLFAAKSRWKLGGNKTNGQLDMFGRSSDLYKTKTETVSAVLGLTFIDFNPTATYK